MGANAQTSVPAFTAGQVLTAQQQTEINTGIPVFATTTTRDAAFGGTGEKTLAEGQFAYIEASNTTQYYDGAAWQSVGGLAVVKAQTSFSAASSITADSVFSSSYTHYTIKLVGVASGGGVSISFKLRASGTSAATNYNYQFIQANSTSLLGVRSASQTAADFGSIGAQENSFTLNLYQPNVATATSFDSINAYNSGAYTAPILLTYTGNHSTATAYDGIEIFVASGTITGNYTIYGWSK